MPFCFSDLTLIERALGDGLHDATASLDLDARDIYGETALHAAGKMGLPLLCQALARERPALLSALDNFNLTPLMLACLSGEPACVKALLPGSALETRSLTGKTALLYAAACSNAPPPPAHGASFSPGRDIMSMLLAAGADPLAKSFFQSTMLHLACAAGAKPCIELSIEALGAEALGSLDNNGLTPRDLARGRLPPMALAALEARFIADACVAPTSSAKRLPKAL